MHLVLLAVPLLLIGFAAGALRAYAARAGLPAPTRRRLTAGWILTLLCGVPAWLVLAAVLGLW